MNQTIKGIIIVVAIAMLVVGATTMVPLAQNTYASTSTCNPSTVGNQTATYNDHTYTQVACTATMSFSTDSNNEQTISIFKGQCQVLSP